MACIAACRSAQQVARSKPPLIIVPSAATARINIFNAQVLPRPLVREVHTPVPSLATHSSMVAQGP